VYDKSSQRSKVEKAVESGRLVVRPRYTLEELLARCDSNTSRTREEQEWLDEKPVGDELM
jgi:antitoxin ChpS